MVEQSEEYAHVDKTLEELRKEIEIDFSNNEYKETALRNLLKKRPALRKTYMCVILTSPSRIGEIMEKTLNQRATQYNHLYELIKLNLIKKISVMDLVEKKIKKKSLNDEEKLVMKKFTDWTSKMNDGMKRNFQAKTCYWCLSEIGKNVDIINFALVLEKIMRDGSQ